MRNRNAFLPLILLVLLVGLDSSRTIDLNPATSIQGFPDEFARYFHDITVPEGAENSGYLAGYRQAALNEMRTLRKGSSRTLAWTERGPGNVPGRTRAIVIDANDPTGDTWLAGSVGGGIWRTEDKGDSWTPLTDHLPRLSISSMAQAASNPAVLYAGTGEGFQNGDAVIGDGVLKSTDGGITWEPLSSTQGDRDFQYVNRVIVSPTDADLVLVATREGVKRSTDGGGFWVDVLEPSSFRGFVQIIDEPGNFNVQYAVDEGSGIWKSVDAGLTWALSSSGLAETGSLNRIEIDVSPADPARLYALVESGGGIDPVYVSTDRAQSWAPFVAQPGSANPDIAGNQGWYDQMVMAHPFDPDVVFMGGVSMYKLSTSGGTVVIRRFTGVDQENTSSFLSFIDFGGGQLGGGLRLGTEEDESTITESQMVTVEVRFGPGRTQFAHRFVPPDQAGVAFSDYPYRDYVEVPFEVWDTTNNRQLHVSFRDRNDDGIFGLIEQNQNNQGREYVIISARTYNASAPEPAIARDGGLVTDMAYFFWPILTPGAEWTPADLPVSILRMNYPSVVAPSRSTSTIGAGVHVDQHTMEFIPTGSDGENFELVAGNDGGVFYSADAGSVWIGRGRGYNTSQFYGVDKKPGVNVYIGGTQDNGSWRSFGNPNASQGWLGAGGGDGFEAIWHKQDPNRMITTSQWTNISRTLTGAQFTPAMSGLLDTGPDCNCAQFITTVSANPENSDIVYTIGRTGVWRSADFAATWQSRPIPEAQWGFGSSGKVRVSNANGDVVWAGYEMDPVGGGGDQSGKLQVSVDNGTTFNSTITPPFAPGRLSGISSSFEDENTVYVTFSFSNSPKILRSTDLGQTWEDLSGFQGAGSGAVSPNGFPDVATFDVIDFPGSPVLWAATEIGIIESLDEGATWHGAANGLPAVSVWQMRLQDDQIVVATHGRGVWTLALSEVPTDIENDFGDDGAQPFRFSLESVYPNPFSESASIRWMAGRGGAAKISVFDVQGRLVATVFDGTVGPGQQEHHWRPTHEAPGAYFVRIETDSGVQTKPLIRVR